MIFRDSKGRAVEITGKEFEMGEGVTITSAIYLDDTHNPPEDVPESELDFLQDQYQDYLYQEACEHRASNAYDAYKDRMKYGDD